MIIANGCTVTLKDSAGNGTVSSQGVIGSAINDGTIKIESGKFVSSADNGFWAGGKNKTGHIIVDGGEITAQECAIGGGFESSIIVNDGTLTSLDNSVLGGNGSAGYEGLTMTINGGQFNGHIQSEGYTGCGIYAPNDGVVTVNGGTFEIDGVGIAARAGKVFINGGEFYSTVDTEGWVGDKKTKLSANGVYYDGAANYPGLKEGAELKITGGTFTNTTNTMIPAVKVTQSATGAQVTVDAGDWTVAE